MTEARCQIFRNKKPDLQKSGFDNNYDSVIWTLGTAEIAGSILSSSPVSVK